VCASKSEIRHNITKKNGNRQIAARIWDPKRHGVSFPGASRTPNATAFRFPERRGRQTPRRFVSRNVADAKRHGVWEAKRVEGFVVPPFLSTFIHLYLFFIVLAWPHDNTIIGSFFPHPQPHSGRRGEQDS
jgi:hypothetical protein